MAKKKHNKWSLKDRLAKKDRAKTETLMGFLLGPYVLSEMHGRPPKIPHDWPAPEQLLLMQKQGELARLQELKLVLQGFLRATGGPDLTPEEAKQFQQFAKANPTVKLKLGADASSGPASDTPSRSPTG